MAITAKSKLYARLVHSGSYEWPDARWQGIVTDYDVWDAYTNFYQYKPDIKQPNKKKN